MHHHSPPTTVSTLHAIDTSILGKVHTQNYSRLGPHDTTNTSQKCCVNVCSKIVLATVERVFTMRPINTALIQDLVEAGVIRSTLG